MDTTKQELLEIYKLHAELADRVSQRREGANRLYVSLITAFLIFLAAAFRFGTGAIPVYVAMLVGSTLGILLSVSWYIVIRSYRQLNSGKFKALHELEQKLAYPFFKREWELLGKELGKEKKASRYWRLTVVETILPIGFGIIFALIFVVSIRIFG